MRPLSSSNPNAPDRAKQPILIDFFAKEEAENQEESTSTSQESPFAELNPMKATSSHHLVATGEPSTSGVSQVTIDSLRKFIALKRNSNGGYMLDGTIQSRLDFANLSAKTLLTAFEMTVNHNHPFLKSIRLKESERYFIFKKLIGIVNRTGGFTNEIKTTAQKANNNPEQLIVKFLELMQ